MEVIILVVAFGVLYWLGVKLNRWVNGSSKIAKNQEKILKELQKRNGKR
jgi:hypothetical protein